MKEKAPFPIVLSAGEKTYLRIKVVPRQPRTEYIDTLEDETIRIRLHAVPERGAANKELIRFLADELGIQKGNIEIVSGMSDPVKLVRVMK